MARLLFLGTGGSTAVISKQLRSSGGIIFQFQDLQFHIDPGPGSLNKAREFGVNLHHNTAILVSHNHINHCNDLNVIIDAMTHGGIEHRGVVLASKSVIQNTENNSPVLTRHHQKMVEKIIALEKNHKVAIESVEIHALPVEHTDQTAIGFRLQSPRFTISYTSDTASTPELIEKLHGSDILILNVPYPGEKSKWLNLDTKAAISIISQVRPKIAIITHFGLDMIRADPLQEARDIQRITSVQTIAAQDGLVITPESYNQQHQYMVKGYS